MRLFLGDLARLTREVAAPFEAYLVVFRPDDGGYPIWGWCLSEYADGVYETLATAKVEVE